MTLFADYASISEDGQIPVFLVNLSSEYVFVGSQDGDFYLKLEVKIGDSWVRAQAHRFGWCGNSYADRVMHPSDFVRLSGYQPATGESVQVRYAFYNQEFDLASNIGEGVYLEADVVKAAADEISVREGNFEHISAIALGGPERNPFWSSAIRALADARFDATPSIAVLREVIRRYPERQSSAQLSINKIERR